MIAAWMLYALLVSVLVAGGAWLLEAAVRQHGGPCAPCGWAPEGFEGPLVIDGVISDQGAMRRLAPDGIERVEVVKGSRASQMFSDPRAANGVIQITTRAAAGTR